MQGLNAQVMRSKSMSKFLIGIGACLLLVTSLAGAGDWVKDSTNDCAAPATIALSVGVTIPAADFRP